jgi:hypothetical protein
MSDPKVQTTVAAHVPFLSPAKAGDPFNFVNEVLKFLTRWSAVYHASVPLGQPAYCCFIGCDRVSSIADGFGGFIERPMFRDDTPQDLLGSVYLASEPLTKIYSRGASFQNLGQCEAVAAELGQASRPIVIFNAAERRMFWKLPADGNYSSLVITHSEDKLTSAGFDDALDRFHRAYTETPNGWCDAWDDPGQLITRRNLERIIRNNLFLFLRTLVRNDLAVFCEYYNPAGRADLLVLFLETSEAFAVELKVLRSYHMSKGGSRKSMSAKFNEWWASRGIAQAYSYKRAESRISAGYACSFDARADNTDIPSLEILANKLNVKHRKFYMFNSADRLHKSHLN